MNNNLTSGNMMSNASAELQGSLRVNHHEDLQIFPPGFEPGLMTHEVFPSKMGQGHECNHSNSRAKNSAINEEDQSSNEEGVEGQMKVHQWQRVKWTNSMAKLLITIVSYLNEEMPFVDCPGEKRKYLNFHKKGKWKSVSKVMTERGFCASPQQCEDKFNDLNKRYKKLNDILGKGIACDVVEKPTLLEMMDHLSEKKKDEVRRILNSKQLFYEEMCSYHNNNRLNLPHDPAIQQALQLALRSRDDHEEYEENFGKGVHAFEKFSIGCESTEEFCKSFQLQNQNQTAEMNATFYENEETDLQEQWLKSKSFQLEDQKLRIEIETLELEKERYKWQRYCKSKDRELEKLRVENKRMKLENERIALELKCMEIGMNSKN